MSEAALEQLRAVRNDVTACRADIGARIDRVESRLENLRLIRAENSKRDLEFALLRADFTAFRDIANTQLSAILRLLGTQTEALHEINDRLLAVQRRQEGEP